MTDTASRLRAVLAPLSDASPEIKVRAGIVHASTIEIDTEYGPHTIHADAYGETTVRLDFIVDEHTAARLVRAYDETPTLQMDLGEALEAARALAGSEPHAGNLALHDRLVAAIARLESRAA